MERLGRMILLLSCLILGSNPYSEAQIPIPAKYDGFVYGDDDHQVWNSVVVEAFFDPMCPDSSSSWPPLKQALQYYSPNVSLIVHPFPLPYHSNSYDACRALHIANKLNSSSTYPLLELFFEYQDNYTNSQTYNISRSSIIEDISKLAVTVVGKNSLPAFLAGFEDLEIEGAARISFKYGCSRGVSGTPFFFVNGILLPDSGSALEFKQWRSILDPLFEDQ